MSQTIWDRPFIIILVIELIIVQTNNNNYVHELY